MTKLPQAGETGTTSEPVGSEVPRLCCSVQEAATALGVAPWTVRGLVSSGILPTVDLPSPTNGKRKLHRSIIPIAALRELVTRFTSGEAR